MNSVSARSAKNSPPRAEIRLTFRFDMGQINLSKALFKLLDIADKQRISLVYFRNYWYIGRIDRDGFWVGTAGNRKSGPYSFVICCKPFTQAAIQALGHGAGEVVRIPIVNQPIQAVDLRLDPTEHPYPYYQLALEQKTLVG